MVEFGLRVLDQAITHIDANIALTPERTARTIKSSLFNSNGSFTMII